MREVTITKKVYLLKELDKETQEKVIERLKREIKEMEIEIMLKEEMEEKAIELLQETFGEKATFKNCFYSLSYCQGDGAMIEFDLETPEETVKVRQSGHYTHERSFTLDYYTEETDKQAESLKEKIIEMNEKLSSFGYNFIEEDPTLADVLEYVEMENMEFLEDGKTFYACNL